ncbi:hypothetical protein N8500_04600 [Candidatus Puniceispirillum sp.]|nr:hypothetical protein [Candidatus Puniceispirillum sp.]
MTEEYDGGPVILREWYEFPKDTNYQAIRVKVYTNGVTLAGKVLKKLMISEMKQKDGIQQDESLAKYLNPIPNDKFNEVVNI